MEKILFFDTETTGVIQKGYQNPFCYYNQHPRVVQLSWKIGDKEGDFIIKPDGFTIPDGSAAVHGITTEKAIAEGVPYHDAFMAFFSDLKDVKTICAHNAQFDMTVIVSEYIRMTNIDRANKFYNFLYEKKLYDTMKQQSIIDFVDARYKNGMPGKFPRLEELYWKLFEEKFPAHNSMEDVRALEKCFFECRKRNLI